MRNANPEIAVIGAGILGASIAYHLSRRGAAVTVFDGADIAAGSGATRASFAWINASAHNARDYVRLRQQSMLEWRCLEAALNGSLDVNWSGSLRWDMAAGDLEAFTQEHASWGYDIRLVDRDTIQTLEPGLAETPTVAAWAPGEGAVDGIAVARALAEAARDEGARLHLDSSVDEVRLDNGTQPQLRLGDEHHEFDRVVVAAGTAWSSLLPEIASCVPMQRAQGLLVRSKPVSPVIDRLLVIEGMYLRQDHQGRIWIAGRIDEQDLGGTAQRQLAAAATLLGLRDGLELEAAIPGNRPMPQDDMPAIGPVAGGNKAYLCVSHSGVTLAPLLGRLAAIELIDEIAVDPLAPYRPDRFAIAS